jgi:hypothetical protein
VNLVPDSAHVIHVKVEGLLVSDYLRQQPHLVLGHVQEPLGVKPRGLCTALKPALDAEIPGAQFTNFQELFLTWILNRLRIDS